VNINLVSTQKTNRSKLIKNYLHSIIIKNPNPEIKTFQSTDNFSSFSFLKMRKGKFSKVEQSREK
jgi:hypothetical protein